MKAMGFSNLEQLEPIKVMNTMIPLLNDIVSSTEKIRDYFKRNIEINDNILDSPGKYLIINSIWIWIRGVVEAFIMHFLHNNVEKFVLHLLLKDLYFTL